MNHITVLGRLGEDPILKSTPKGTSFCKFSIAQKNRSRNKTNWFRVVAWGKVAEIVVNNLRKGVESLFEGSLEESVYEQNGQKRRVHEIWLDKVHFISSRDGAGAAAQDDDDPF